MDKKVKLLFKIIFVFSFVSFITFYISLKSGYYEYNNRKKMTFTSEQITQFEDDVKNGKNIDIESYLKNSNKNYQNKISKLTLDISLGISKYTKKGINIIFKKIGNAIEQS